MPAGHPYIYMLFCDIRFEFLRHPHANITYDVLPYRPFSFTHNNFSARDPLLQWIRFHKKEITTAYIPENCHWYQRYIGSGILKVTDPIDYPWPNTSFGSICSLPVIWFPDDEIQLAFEFAKQFSSKYEVVHMYDEEYVILVK